MRNSSPATTPISISASAPPVSRTCPLLARSYNPTKASSAALRGAAVGSVISKGPSANSIGSFWSRRGYGGG